MLLSLPEQTDDNVSILSLFCLNYLMVEASKRKKILRTVEKAETYIFP